MQQSCETGSSGYMSSVQSIISYGILFWGSAKGAVSIFRAQKRIVRSIFGLHPRTSCKPFFAQLGILTVPSLYFFSLVVFVKKNPELFRTNRDGYSSGMTMLTRNRDALGIPFHNSTFFEYGPAYQAIKAYNMLPHGLRQIQSLKVFKTKIKTFLLEKRFYSFNFEF